MATQTPFDNHEVATTYSSYYEPVRSRLLALRELVIETAEETEGVTGFGEALRWGEPSFVTKSGSTIRLDQAGPDKYALYFNCQSKLVDTYKALFPQRLRFDGNRAIVLDVAKPLPVDELRVCISLALTYHRRKHLELLGA